MEEMGAQLGPRTNIMLPSGKYFLGQPLFFFEDSEDIDTHNFYALHVPLSLLLLKGSEERELSF